MRLKRHIMITPEGAYYLFVMSFVFTGAVLREINLMLVLAGMMLGPLVYNARTARRMTRNLTVRRRLPDSATAGEPVTVELLLSSKSRFAGMNLVDSIRRLDSSAHETIAKCRAPLAEGAAGQPVVARYTLVAAQRGEYLFGPLQARSSYPFGLIRRAVQHDLAGTLLVFPRLGVLSDRWSAMLNDALLERSGSRRQTHSAGDFYGLRDYRSGDSRRHIHWRTSARRGKLMVRQFERARRQDVAVYVDLWQPVRATDDDRQHVERAVSFAATLVNDMCHRDGFRVWLAIAGEDSDPLYGAASTGFARHAMARLACAKPNSEANNRVSIKSALAYSPRGMMRVVLTSRRETTDVAHSLHSEVATEDSWSSDRLVYLSTREARFDEWFTLETPANPGCSEQLPGFISLPG